MVLLCGALAGALFAVWLAHEATRNLVVQPDEELYMGNARYVLGHFPQGLLATQGFVHGLQRSNVVLLALVLAITHAPSAFVLYHVLATLAFVSTAIPVWWLVRMLGGSPAWALAAAAGSVLVPWAVVATSLLTEATAYPIFAWAMLALTWSITARTRRAEVAALVALAVAPLARTSFLALPLAYAAALVVQAVKFPPPGGPGGRLRRVPGTLWAGWPLSCALALLLLLIAFALAVSQGGLSGPLHHALGGYYSATGSSIGLGGWIDRSGYFLMRIAVGTGVLPMILALPWLLAHAVLPRREEPSGFALVAVLGAVLLLITSYPSTPDERYVMYLAPLVLSAAAIALSSWARSSAEAEREPSRRPWLARPHSASLACLVGGLGCAWLVLRNGDNFQTYSPYSYFVFPAGTAFHYFVVRGTHLLGLSLRVEVAGAVMVLMAAVLLWAVLRLELQRRAPTAFRCAAVALLLGALAAAAAVQTQYAVGHFISRGARTTAARSQASASWIDGVTHGAGWVMLAALAPAPRSAGVTSPYVLAWRETEFWNPDVQGQLDLGRGVIPLPTYTPVLRARLGAGRRLQGLGTSGRYIAVPMGARSREVQGRVVGRSPYLGVVLLRLDGTARGRAR